MGFNRFRRDTRGLVQLYQQGRLNLDELISAHIALNQMNIGFRRLRGGEVAPSVIDFDTLSDGG